METTVTRLEVTAPDGSSRLIDLAQDSLVVGRRTPDYEPDMALEDPDSLISRRHCVLERAWGSWWVDDPGSRNGTFVRRRGDLVRVTERTNLYDGDVVCIAGVSGDGDGHLYWELRLLDPSSTASLEHEPGDLDPDTDEISVDAAPYVTWDARAFRLEVVAGGERRAVELRKQGYDLVGHMATVNATNGHTAVVCSVDDLLAAVWGPTEDWHRYRPPTADNLRDIVSMVRKEIEPDPSSPQILENIRGVGYRLHTSPHRIS